MRKGFLNHVLYCSLMFGFVLCLGFSSWVYVGKNETENDVTTKGNEHTVRIMTRQYDDEASTTIEYFIPDEYENNYNITYKLGSDGNPITTKISIRTSTDSKANANNVGCSLAGATLNYDEMVQYYDNNVVINQRSNMTITRNVPFASYSTTVKTWKKVNDKNFYTDVWKACIKASETPDGKGNLDNDYYYFKIQGSSGNTLSGHGAGKDNCPNEGDVIGEEYVIKDEKTGSDSYVYFDDNGNEVTETRYGRILCRKVEEVVYSNKVSYYMSACNRYSTTPYANWSYYPTFQERMVRRTRVLRKYNDVELSKTIKVKDKSKITPKDLGISGYDTMGFFTSSEYDELYDFTKPITSDVVLYAKEFVTDDTLYNSVASNKGTLNLYDSSNGGSGSDTSLDLSLLKNNDSDIRAIYLKKSTVQKGSTLNLTFNDSKIINGDTTGVSDDVNSFRSTDSSSALDYNGSSYIGFKPSTHLLLNGDLTVSGTLNVGAKIGDSSGNSNYSYIIDYYSVLDLYGHNIIVDGGVINCYGVIKDSVGTGKIYLKNGAKIISTLSVSDGNGRDQNVIGLRMRQFPFNDYRFNYLQVPVEIMNGCSFGAFLRIDATLNICNVIFNIIDKYSSTNSSNAVFAWTTNNSDEKVDYIPYRLEELSTPSADALYLQMHNWRNRFVFDANMREVDSLQISLTAMISSIKLDLKVDLARYDVPISSFFDLILLQNRTMDIYSKMTFYPGSMFYALTGSKLHFTKVGNKTYDASESGGLGVQKETRYVSGGIMTYTSRIADLANDYSVSNYSLGIVNNSKYWKFNKFNNVNIDGDVSFDSITDPQSDAYYYLSGVIGLSDSALNTIKDNRRYIKTYDFKAQLTGGFLYSNAHSSSDSFYEFATSYNCNTLISGNKAYLLDKDHEWTGAYNVDTGIFTNDDTSSPDVFLLTDTDMLETGSDGSNSSSDRIDRTLSITEIQDKFEDYRIVKANNIYYAYFAGIYIPVLDNSFDGTGKITNGSILKANERKFMSNRDSYYERSMTTNKKYMGGNNFSLTSGILKVSPTSSTSFDGISSNISCADNTKIDVTSNTDGTASVSVSNTNYGSASLTIDASKSVTIQNKITSSKMTLVDNSSSSKTVNVSTNDGSSSPNKTSTTVSYSSSQISINITISGSNNSTLNIMITKGKVNLSSNGFQTDYTHSVTATTDYILCGTTYAKTNFSKFYDRGMIQFVSSVKRWKHYGFADYPKDNTLSEYYSY